MIDLDPLWRLVIAFVMFGAIPLLLVAGWVARKIRDSCTAVLVRSWCNGYLRRKRHHAPAPAGPGQDFDTPGSPAHYLRRNP